MQPKLFGLSLLLALASLQAHALGNIADVTVVDRSSGATIPLHYHRGEYWVAGRPGAKYAISVRNKTGERLLAVTAVDGVNVLSGETAGWEQTGYVFSPYRGYQITGWRRSSSEVAAFEFTASANSYAERTDRPDHVGVIGVALFRERLPEPVAQAPDYSSSRNESDQSAKRLGNAPSSVPPSPSSPAPAGASSERRAKAPAELQGAPARDSLAKSAPMPAPKLGTGFGESETSRISHTNFARLQNTPNEVLRIRYDSRENLIASGVIREPRSYPPVAGPYPFPESRHTPYVADPPPRRY